MLLQGLEVGELVHHTTGPAYNLTGPELNYTFKGGKGVNIQVGS